MVYCEKCYKNKLDHLRWIIQCKQAKIATDLLWRSWEGSDQLGHDGFDFRVTLVQMFGQRAHEDDHTLPHRVIAGVLRRALQKLLKHGQQRAHVVLRDRNSIREWAWLQENESEAGGAADGVTLPCRVCWERTVPLPACSAAPLCVCRLERQAQRTGTGARPDSHPRTQPVYSAPEQCHTCTQETHHSQALPTEETDIWLWGIFNSKLVNCICNMMLIMTNTPV